MIPNKIPKIIIVSFTYSNDWFYLRRLYCTCIFPFFLCQTNNSSTILNPPINYSSWKFENIDKHIKSLLVLVLYLILTVFFGKAYNLTCSHYNCFTNKAYKLIFRIRDYVFSNILQFFSWVFYLLHANDKNTQINIPSLQYE